MTEYREGMLTVNSDQEVMLFRGQNIVYYYGVYKPLSGTGTECYRRRVSIRDLLEKQDVIVPEDIPRVAVALEHLTPGMVIPVKFKEKKPTSVRYLIKRGSGIYVENVPARHESDWNFTLTHKRDHARECCSRREAEELIESCPENIKDTLHVEIEKIPEE